MKFHNEHNALRFETTLNNPAPFKVWRCKEGSADGAKERLPLRKSVADIPLRAKVCGEINARFIGQTAQVKETARVRELVASVGRKTREGRTVRTLDILGNVCWFVRHQRAQKGQGITKRRRLSALARLSLHINVGCDGRYDNSIEEAKHRLLPCR